MIHQYKLNGYNIVLDTYSGAVHAVDDVAYDIISLYENTARDDIIRAITARYPEVGACDVTACMAEIEALKENKQLFTEDTYAGIADALKGKSNDIKALCLHVAHTCNLNCSYCFASQGRYQGERALMSFDVGKQALDFLIAHSGKRTNLEVDFFGGEPLMNWEVVKQLVAYGRSREAEAKKRFRFTLTTNGVLVDDEVIDFWRVEDLSENQRLLLRAEMKLPGHAWMEFRIMPAVHESGLVVSAYFAPRGWFGTLYWYIFLPFHRIIFKNLLRQIDARA
jgi:uncharacterized protein